MFAEEDEEVSIPDRIVRISDKYLGLAENNYVNAVVAALLIFTVIDEVIVSFQGGFGEALTKAEHGLFFLYLNLLIASLARLSKAYIHHRRSRHDI